MKPLTNIYATGRFLSLVYQKDGRSVPVCILSTEPQFSDATTAFLNEDWDNLYKIAFPEQMLDTIVTAGLVTVKEGVVYYNNEPVRHVVAQKILDFRSKGYPIKPLMRFLEKLLNNSNANSIEQFYDFLERNNLTICEDGDFIGYKGVQEDGYSVSSGKEELIKGERNDQGKILNQQGFVVKMKREDVHGDQSVGCSYGLHVGSWNYAHKFAPKVFAIKVNPADVVSVPSDCNYQKVRVCTYKVLNQVKSPIESDVAKVQKNYAKSLT